MLFQKQLLTFCILPICCSQCERIDVLECMCAYASVPAYCIIFLSLPLYYVISLLAHACVSSTSGSLTKSKVQMIQHDTIKKKCSSCSHSNSWKADVVDKLKPAVFVALIQKIWLYSSSIQSPFTHMDIIIPNWDSVWHVGVRFRLWEWPVCAPNLGIIWNNINFHLSSF